MATITSNQSGDWDATSTWVGGSVPAADDSVVIAHGHKVTLDTNIQSTRTGDVTIDGNLHFANGGKMHLHGRMTVNNTSNNNNTAGEFAEGTSTSGSLLSMVGGTEIKISGTNSDQHGVQVNSRKWCGVDIQGGEPTLITQLNGAATFASTYLTVDSVTNFAAGDLISLYEREVDYRLIPDECFYIHDIDTTNKRLYVRQYVTPTATVLSKSGSTITVDDASVFRVGYKIIFGTGSNRNALKITAINGNVITFGSSVSGTVANTTAYVTGTEKAHPDNREVRRLATTLTTAISSINSTNQITVGNASDFSVGSEIMLEASSTNINARQYTSGSETNSWRHNITYTVSSISGNTLTLNRNIPYYSDEGCLVVLLDRDVVIKACKDNGDEVPDGDQDSARVFFNVRYWTDGSYYAAPTRRVKIKYVRFKNLGYNTNDSTNFRAGVTIAGYNGRYEVARGNTHTSWGFTRTGENYLDGCVVTAFSLVSNTTRDGDSYPSICIRHPYSMAVRNCVAVGTGRGIWHWSSQYYIKSHGHIAAVSNYTNLQCEAMYEHNSELSYCKLMMAEDYGFMLYHVRQNDSKKVRHIHVLHQHSNAMYMGDGLVNTIFDKVLFERYRYAFSGSNDTANAKFINSKVLPNLWDGTNLIFNGENGYFYSDYIHLNTGGQMDFWRFASPETKKVLFFEHGFKSDEYMEMYHRIFRIKSNKYKDWEILVSDASRSNLMDSVYVPANTTVKLQSQIYVNPKTYGGSNASINSDGYPYFFAKPNFGDVTSMGRQTTGQYISNKGGSGFDNTYVTNNYFGNSTDSADSLYNGFLEIVQHTSTAVGAWENKELTVQPQNQGYMLCFGYIWDNDSMRNEGMKMKDIKVAMSTPSRMPSKTNNSRVSVRTSFNTGKKRIGGTRL